jgi:hypothetical protein
MKRDLLTGNEVSFIEIRDLELMRTFFYLAWECPGLLSERKIIISHLAIHANAIKY